MARCKRSKEIKGDGTPAPPCLNGTGEFVLSRRIANGDLEVVASGLDDCLQALDRQPASLTTGALRARLERLQPLDVKHPFLAPGSMKHTTPKITPKRTPHFDKFRVITAATHYRGSIASDNEDDALPVARTMRAFQISDRDNVEKYLLTRLVALQQQAGKRIAKAWIKGICPKKQAQFPYQDSVRKKKDGLEPAIPDWWPALDICGFREPDHISKEWRMALCLHFLRLRPTFDQLKEWNSGNKEVTDLCRTHEFDGWTAFLRQLTPNSIFDGLEPEKPNKRRQREELLRQMYDVADKEEKFLKGECDGTNTFNWDEVVDIPRSVPLAGSKRSRQSSTTSDTEPSSAEHSGSERESKKPRRRSGIQGTKPDEHAIPFMDVKMPLDEDGNMWSGDNGPSRHDRHSLLTRQNSDQPNRTQHAQLASRSRCSSVDYSGSSYNGSPVIGTPISSSFGSSHQDMYDAPESRGGFPGQHEYMFQHHHNVAQVYLAPQMPTPEFSAAPNSSVFGSTYMPSTACPGQDSMLYAAQHQQDVNYSNGPQHQQVDGQHFMPAYDSSHIVHAPYVTAGYAVAPQHALAPPMPSPQRPFYDSESIQCQNIALNGLPTQYSGMHVPQMHNGRHQDMYHPELRPDSNLPAASLPGSVTRGFTGHGSGVGNGAWT